MPRPQSASDEDRTPTDLIEQGVGLIAQGMFRKGDPSRGNDPRTAYDEGMAAVNTIRGLAFDFLKRANAQSR